MAREVKNQEEQLLRGTIRRVTYRNPENGYCVLQLEVENSTDQITLVANCLEVSAGQSLLAHGSFITHPRFGRQFAASRVDLLLPETPEEIEKFLGSGLIKGIGEKSARKLVETFGKDTLETIRKHPEKVAKVQGIGRNKARLMSAALSSQSELDTLRRILVEKNISPNLAARIYERYGARTLEILRTDPYLLAREMFGVGFLTADSIAMNMGIKPDAPQRLKAGIYYALEQAADDGHCHLPQAELIQKAGQLLGLPDVQDLSEHLESLIREDYIVRDAERVALRHIARAEEFVARFISSRCGKFENPNVHPDTVTSSLQLAASELGVEFSAEQEQAVFDATAYGLLIITGGPGCGKTTIIRALTALGRAARKRVMLCAPTGRAAQRMAQVCAMDASTIHRLLKYDPHRRAFQHGIDNPLNCDMLIVDEASMIDILLARDLFSAVPPAATLVLVGDKDQLPSVGPGRVFGELVSLTSVRTVSLSVLFRRSLQSNINPIAHTINSGITPSIPEPDGETKSDAYFITRPSVEEAAALIESLTAEQIPRKFGLDSSQISVLTPSNRGPLGTQELNKRLQARLNPASCLDDTPHIRVGEQVFFLGDRVCQRVNNYNIHEAGVFNGDLGQVYSINSSERSMVVELWDGRLIKYEQGDLSQLSLAYAVSVHRSQGSEIPCVVLALHESHYILLERQLLYTGVTRAKKLLIIVGSKKALAIACRKSRSMRRYSMLKERIERFLD